MICGVDHTTMIKVNDCISHYVYKIGYGKVIFTRCFLNHHRHFHYTLLSDFPFSLSPVSVHIDPQSPSIRRDVLQNQETHAKRAGNHHVAIMPQIPCKSYFLLSFLSYILSQMSCYQVAALRFHRSVWKGRKVY